MIDEQLRNLYLEAIAHGRGEDAFGYDEKSMAEDLKQALTAIYEIGLEAMPEPKTPDTTKEDWANIELQQVKGFNTCLLEVKKAWAKACGVAEK